MRKALLIPIVFVVVLCCPVIAVSSEGYHSSAPDLYSEEETEKYKTFLYCIRNDRLNEAEKSAEEIKDKEFQQAAYTELSMAYARIGEFEKAKNFLAKIRDFEKSWMARYFLIVDGYAAHGYSYEALHAADRLLSIMEDHRVNIYDKIFDGQKLFVDISMAAAESGHYCCLSRILHRITSFYYYTMAVENVLLRVPRAEAEKFLVGMGYIQYNPTPQSLGQDMADRPGMRGQMNSIAGDLIFYYKSGLILVVKYGMENGEKAFVVGHVYTGDQRKKWQESR